MKHLLLLFPLALIIGLGGAAMTGMIDVPGFSPEQPKPQPAQNETVKGAARPESAPPLSGTRTITAPRDVLGRASRQKLKVQAFDAELGRKQLARLWRQVETPQLLKIVAKWTDTELAAVMANLPSAKASEMLSAMSAVRASRISREIQRQASLIPAP